jgi:hypothetical protein
MMSEARRSRRAHVTLRLSYTVDPLNYPEGSDTTENQILNYEEEWWDEDPVTMLDTILSDESVEIVTEVKIE